MNQMRGCSMPDALKKQIALRGQDPDWQTHAAFYSGITDYLTPGALLFIDEIWPHKSKVIAADMNLETDDVLDERPDTPFNLSLAQATAGGLVYVGSQVVENDVAAALDFTIEVRHFRHVAEMKMDY